MQTSPQVAPQSPTLYENLLRGYRFRVCPDTESVTRALDVRRLVYLAECGYHLPVPDAYDSRSWFLLAEHVASGKAVGSMRITPRAEGPLEAEEYFELPASLRSRDVVECTRFAVLPDHRNSRRFLPVVALGLYKLAVLFVRQLGATDVVICSKPERAWAYQWLAFTPTGLTAQYTKLAGTEHELMTADVRDGMLKHRDHRYWQFVFDIDHPEITVPRRAPQTGLDPTRVVPMRRSA